MMDLHYFIGQGDITTACKRGFLTVDETLGRDALKDDSSGCTAVAIIAKGNKFYCVSRIYQKYTSPQLYGFAEP